MDFLIVVVILLIILVAVGVSTRKKHLSGETGEKKVSDSVTSVLEDGEIIFNNFIAKRNKEGTHSIQIDHILLSHKGIFVIETKDYRGRIYGDAYQTYWTQVLAYGNTKNKVYNPIKQNETHLNYVKRLINRNYSYFNVVIFVKADLSHLNGVYNSVFDINQFKRWYRNLTTDCYLSNEEISTLKSKFDSEMEENFITKEQHISNVREKHNKEQSL